MNTRPSPDPALLFRTRLQRLHGRVRRRALAHGLLRWGAAVGLLVLSRAHDRSMAVVSEA